MKTINEALQLVKATKQRIKSLEEMRDKVSTKERFYGSADKQVEPLYSVQSVDVKLTKLQELLFSLESAIKHSNAITQLDTGAIDFSIIFEPLT